MASAGPGALVVGSQWDSSVPLPQLLTKTAGLRVGTEQGGEVPPSVLPAPHPEGCPHRAHRSAAQGPGWDSHAGQPLVCSPPPGLWGDDGVISQSTLRTVILRPRSSRARWPRL